MRGIWGWWHSPNCPQGKKNSPRPRLSPNSEETYITNPPPDAAVKLHWSASWFPRDAVCQSAARRGLSAQLRTHLNSLSGACDRRWARDSLSPALSHTHTHARTHIHIHTHTPLQHLPRRLRWRRRQCDGDCVDVEWHVYLSHGPHDAFGAGCVVLFFERLNSDFFFLSFFLKFFF